MFSRLILLTTLLLATPVYAVQLDSPPVPGGIAIIALPDTANPASVRYRDKRVLVTDIDGVPTAIIGLSLGSKPGRHFLHVKDNGGAAMKVAFEVRDKAYEEQRITIKDKRKVNPEKRDMERIKREKAGIKRALRHWSDTGTVPRTFRFPVPGPTSAPSVRRRF